jgi:tetratricopeptide (TPR) repeat protein
MQQSKVIKRHDKVCRLILSRQVADALDTMRLWAREAQQEFLNDRLDELQLTYKNILLHSFSAVKDPERHKVYAYLLRSLLDLADELRENMLTTGGEKHTYQLKHTLQKQGHPERREVLGMLEDLTFDRELAGLLRDVNITDNEARPSREEALVRVFNIIWLSDKYSETELSLLNAVCDSNTLPWHDKALIVSALTLSLLRFFDVSKFQLLHRFVSRQQDRVWERAMVGLFVSFLKYNDRFSLYPVLEEITSELSELPQIEQHIEAILIQFTKSKETEKVKKKWEEEILPEIMKMRPKIEEKLDLDNIFQEDFSEEKNPDWETVFEDVPDLLNKLQEFTEMQMEGMDVFMSAFSQLKQFPFFREISNWFVPFYAENQVLDSAFRGGEEEPDMRPLFEKLADTFFMCDSDKYSFALNLSLVPLQQKQMMMNMLSNEMQSLSDLEKEESITNRFAMTRSIYTQYLQDLYRFYKLHPWRTEFDDIFSLDIGLYETHFVNKLVTDNKTIRNIAELFFDKQFYPDALRIFLSILEKDKSNIELFEKIAFCFERTGQFKQAYDYYQKADLIEADRLWIVRKLAFCSKRLSRWEDALHYDRLAEKLDPDDLKIQASIGQTLIYLGRYEEALACYFKVEVMAPENYRIRRPLAWCSFLTGKLDTARDYLMRLLANEPDNRFDLMNLGHVLWCMKKPEEALEMYRKSVRAWKGDVAGFVSSFNEDRKHLQKCNISSFDMDLMVDYLKISLKDLD